MTAKLKYDFSSRLHALRAPGGLTMRQLAEAAGITEAAVSKLERTGCNPRLSTVRALAAALGVTPVDLIG